MTDRIILQTEPSADTALLAWDVVIAHAKTIAEKTFDLYQQMGVLDGIQSVGCRRENGLWEIWGHFQDANGRRNALVAQFDDVTDAVDFGEMVRRSIK